MLVSRRVQQKTQEEFDCWSFVSLVLRFFKNDVVKYLLKGLLLVSLVAGVNQCLKK